MTSSFIIFFTVYSEMFICIIISFMSICLSSIVSSIKTACLLCSLTYMTHGLQRETPQTMENHGVKHILMPNLVTSCYVCLCFRWTRSPKRYQECWAREALSKGMSLIRGRTSPWYVASLHTIWEYVTVLFIYLFSGVRFLKQLS